MKLDPLIRVVARTNSNRKKTEGKTAENWHAH